MNLVQILITIISVFVVGVIALQYQSFKQWLVWGVSEAEEYFGSGTGQLKLQYAYNLAIEKYPMFVKFIPFSAFSWLVDKSLKTMADMIKNNSKIAEILTVKEVVKGE